MKLTERELTAILKDGVLHIVLPDDTAESGFKSYKVSADQTYINRGVLLDNDVFNAVAYHVYSTDSQTDNLPNNVNKQGVLEAYGKSALELRYTCFTNNTFEYWTNKREDNSWLGWQKLSIKESDIDHNKIKNTHNLTSDIDHDQIANTHNLTSDIDHNQLANYESNEHIDWTNANENFSTHGSIRSDKTFFKEKTQRGSYLFNCSNISSWFRVLKLQKKSADLRGHYHLDFFTVGGNIGYSLYSLDLLINWSVDIESLITRSYNSVFCKFRITTDASYFYIEVLFGVIPRSLFHVEYFVEDYNKVIVYSTQNGITTAEQGGGNVVFEKDVTTGLVVESRFGIKTNKNITASNFILASDISKKMNIQPFNTNVDDIKIQQFNYKDDTEKRKRYGVIAQLIEKEHPEFVYTDSDGFKSVAYIDLLLAKVAYLEEKIKQLDNK